ncbi:DUF4407 domain-containing protein [Virgisporangium aurantiacum]|uniref:DUF4407 domain-containing protein n=1 Tax=Virgisporangium aurantiacum TaxID=175570 RepID=A0A8J3ZIK7_9ACTN|nr:DUF4407 domain-containing protein [Virgisporangium aurantiacum]GIJ64772.1 hypothetical protein Vau01_122880 [Virgisporangium aurantiacum]
MRRVFIWLSGADPAILRNCTNLTNSERIRFASLGALVLIPAILGAFAMSYALSLMTHRPTLYMTGGLLWGLAVLTIDRYIVATLYKSTIRHWFGTTSSVLIRLLFAVLIGTAVAHPLVLLWFKDSLTQNLAEDRRTAVANRIDRAKADAAAVPTAASESAPLERQREERVARLDCLSELQTYEQSSNTTHVSGCGVTSGSVTCGPRCAEIGNQINQVREEIRILDGKIETARKADAAASKSRQETIDAIDKKAREDLADIEAKFSDDYLARVAALSELEQQDQQVRFVKLFMIGLFVFVDIMPLTMKLATPMGEYERVRDTMVIRSIHAEEAKQAAIPQIEAALAQMYADSERLTAEMNALAKVSIDMLHAWHEHRVVIEEQVRIVRQRTPQGEELATEGRILDVRKIDQQAWDSIVARTMAFMTR